MTNIATKGETPKSATTDEIFMRRCIQLARNSEGRTYPNPMVGAVIVCDGKIIGEGWHRKAGCPHAEVNAIRSVRNPELLTRSTIYVSLEPCAHYGRTPPCADLIIEKRIPRVVVGCGDTFAKVSGRGIQKLRDAGISVTVGVLEEECRELNRRFFTLQEKKRPYVILKWAQTTDGYIGNIRDGLPAPAKISNREALTIAHRQRTTEDGILIGAGTAVADAPSLTPRLWDGPAPLRIVVDTRGKLPEGIKLLTDGGRTLIINPERDLEEGNVKYVRGDFANKGVAVAAIEAAGSEGLTSVIVEGGAKTLSAFIKSGLWDEAWVFVADSCLGSGVRAPEFSGGDIVETLHLGDCLLRVFRNK